MKHQQRAATRLETTIEHVSYAEVQRIRGRKDLSGGGPVLSRAAQAEEPERRRRHEAKILREAAGRPILREWFGDQPCRWLGPVIRETSEHYIYPAGMEMRMAKADAAAHIKPCSLCSDWPEKGEASRE